jgi:uncharacterized OB-fold protein
VTGSLVQAHVLEFPGGYQRSLGPVVGRYLTGLRDGRFLGVRTPSGRVVVPPTEYDPDTGEPVGEEFIEVGPAGTVTTWAWVSQPRPKHPLDRPFAWALIRLDGADTALLHVVDVAKESAVHTGMRVQARWRDERVGHVLDVECFVPEEPGNQEAAP